ncbi:MAG: rhodanese-like domain-containing protein [Janthinobacterium lividum]
MRAVVQASLAAALAGWVVAAAPAPEPPGLWAGEERGAVPATLAGGQVVDTAALAALLAQGNAVAVDVSVAQRRPEGMSPNAVWLPLVHRDIAGSVWMPDAGQAVLAPATEAWVHGRLEALTGGDPARPLVFYCHPECWRSWNAAKRAVGWGYRAVAWYPQGIEGWAETGRAMASPPVEIAP